MQEPVPEIDRDAIARRPANGASSIGRVAIARASEGNAIGYLASAPATAADSIGCAAIAPASEECPLAIELDLIGHLAGRAASEAVAKPTIRGTY